MSSWKVRLLMVLSMVAMLIAVSVPAMANDRGFDHGRFFDPFLVDDRASDEASSM